MAGSDDDGTSSPDGSSGNGKVIPMAGRRRSGAAERARRRVAASALAPDPPEETGGLLARLDAWDLDASIADLNARIDTGREDLRPLRQVLRNWHAVRSHLRGDRGAASAEWAELIDQGFHEALITRASYHQKDGDFAAALADYDRAAQHAPKDGAVYRERGLLFYFRLGEPERALADIARAAQLLPHDPEPYSWMARIMVSQRNEEGAIRALGRAIKRAPRRADLFHDRGRLWWSKGAIAEALADLDRCIALDPTLPGAFQLRAFCHERRGDPASAVADYTQAIALDPSEAAYLKGRGDAHLATGAYEAAIDDLTRVLDLRGGEDADAYYSRGAAHLARGDEQRASWDYRRAFHFDPALLEHVELDVRVHRELGRTEELRRSLDILIAAEPIRHCDLRLDRARIVADAGDLDGALADIDRALEVVPRWDTAFRERARILAQFGRFDRAVEDASKAAELAPHLPSHLAWRAVYRARAEGDTPGARADIDRAVELAEYDPEIRSCRVTYFSMIGKLDEAIADLDMLIMLDRLEPQHYRDRAAAREMRGDLEGAAADLIRAAALLRGRSEP